MNWWNDFNTGQPQTVFEFAIKSKLFQYIPDDKGRFPAGKGQIRRWLDGGAVEINGKRLKADDSMEFPVTSIIVFPSGHRRTIV